MTMREFRNVCNTMSFIDRYMLFEFEENRWRMFLDGPLMFFHQFATETERKDIWQAVERLMAK